jgi:hypothetical protein
MGDVIDEGSTHGYRAGTERPTEYLSVADYIAVVTRVTGFSQEEVATEDLVEAARRALNAPAAEAWRGEEWVQLYPGLAAKAAAMCRGLLRHPPHLSEAGKIAYLCLEQLLLRNGAEWRENAQLTVLHFNRVAGDPGAAAELSVWMGERIATGAGGGAEPTLFQALGETPTVVYLAGPLKDLDLAQREELERVREQVLLALEEVRRQTGSGLDIQLEHPSTCLCPSSAPDYCSTEIWEFTSRQLVESVDALVVVDVALETAGFGATSELDLHCLQEGPVLYLRSAAAPGSRFLSARAEELDLEIVPYGGAGEIGAIVAEWMLRRWGAVRRAARGRADRRLQYGPLKRRLDSAWKRADPHRRDLAAAAAGMKPQAVSRVLTSTSLLSVLPSHRLDSLCRELEVPSLHTHGQQARIDAATAPNYGALLEAADEERWSAEAIAALFRDGRESEGTRGFATRPRYQQPGDWKKRFRDLGL